ncbi:MAG: DNA repair protein RecO [Candidatus Marinimicrobia bacterium]|jgi:DNA repair protein RecO|nr:DNA repair protein RecO [Candidatus Neomarinimicrobiota bacterium]MBT3839888.1 DNA repair protein RecO [Candidatus Neomarinimicrobiota bacterium]MBT3999619.1 DNA repair protein RecO [Candidatus Neomarinimicrobiota bacterium]MBT4383301.1 DNA repair protein RecO [Candidatus Neomarinimicrobiota bacterium]MBT4957785.1 DNA repair protein RecO [Candidatus Neomarinimicrobiota bacterium]
MIIHTPVIVLKSFPYGDTSIIARCFSKDKGKISLIVKGARSKKSPKSAQFQPLSYIDVIYYNKPSRDLQVLSKVSFRESWSKIPDNLRSITLTMAILEITEKTLSDEDPHPKLFEILVDTLRGFNKSIADPNILFWFYECALLTHLGFQPVLDKREFSGLTLPDPNSGPNSGLILASLLAGDIGNLPTDDVTPLDRTVIGDYLWTSLRYHFDSLSNIKSMKVVRKILAD